MPDDQLLQRDDRWAVRLERRLDHPIEKVWRAVTEPEHLAAWFPARVSGELRVDGTLHFAFDPDAEPEPGGTVLDLDPPHTFAFTWQDDEFRIDLSPDGDQTVLVLLHTFDDKPGAASFAAGWDQCLAAIGPHLAGQPAPEPDRGIERHEQLAARFGLSQPTVAEAGGQWTVRFERQLTCPADVAWDLFLGHDGTTQAQRATPDVGDPLTPVGAPDVPSGTVTEIDRPHLLAFAAGPDAPGDHVRLEFGEGTGHGARLVLTIAGTTANERDTAVERWQRGAVEHVAAQAAALSR